ncbi:MAG: ISAs1 family transposase [Leptolyngbyaceae cyanobacterium SM1_1_3]|nr:ISAs1 family transposase [Leptolyngbyaceae cyanobacterium SM1_1_3]NJN02854.1 ISAs1 family transposase [Leptolyngbyaceae cyanobacterium RM1_1_2]NJO09095.1 ISAs1 family transposase [Leptolyngbyaceae cyanobacterium SL_1_1]
MKGNQSTLHKSVQASFVAQESYSEISKGHGRIEQRGVNRCTTLDKLPSWPRLQAVIRVERQRHFKQGGHPCLETETRYLVASFVESAEAFAQRIRGCWSVENKVHSVCDVTQGEDASRIRMHPLPQIFAVARNFAPPPMPTYQ